MRGKVWPDEFGSSQRKRDVSAAIRSHVHNIEFMFYTRTLFEDYRVFADDERSIEIGTKGMKFAVLISSGAGKTTLLACMAEKSSSVYHQERLFQHTFSKADNVF